MQRRIGRAARQPEIASEDKATAAIASDLAQNVFQLKRVVEPSIEDRTNNKTRFWVLSRDLAEKAAADGSGEGDLPKYKTCLVVKLDQHAIGGLHKVFGCFAKVDLNVSLVYPCPIPHFDFEYTFFFEVEGYCHDMEMTKAYDSICDMGLFRGNPLMLGCYQAVAEPGPARSVANIEGRGAVEAAVRELLERPPQPIVEVLRRNGRRHRPRVGDGVGKR
jgi:prephenate dehydratase